VIVPEGHGLWTEYAGGYSDMLAQRGADLTRERRKPEPRKAVNAPASAATEPPKRRMTFKDKHALETLPKTIAALQEKSNALQAALEDPQLYARDRAAFEKSTITLAELQKRIAAAEEQWLELEASREDVAGG
jgi:ATP-binding cassette subfamily F protein uup